MMTSATDVPPAVQTVVLSWSGVLSQLFDGSITFDELEGALFYFGCSREHAFNPQDSEINELDDIARADPVKGLSVHLTLLQLLREAEAHGRVAWRDPGDSPNYGQLNQLLRRFKLPVIQATRTNRIATGNYNLHEIHRMVVEQKLPLRIISIAGL